MMQIKCDRPNRARRQGAELKIENCKLELGAVWADIAANLDENC